MTVGEPAVVEQLQQDVEDVGMRLFDLVEQDHRVGTAAHGFRQLAALVEADVTRRRADQPRNRVLLHVLGHVDPDHGGFAVEQELGQCAREFGLADAGGAEKNERPDRTIGILESGPRANYRVGDRRHRFVLADDAFVQMLLEMRELLHLAFEQARDRYPGPSRDDFGDIVLVNFFLEQSLAAGVFLDQFLFFGGELLLQRCELAVLQLGDLVEVVLALCFFDCELGLLDFGLDFCQLLEPTGLGFPLRLQELRAYP